MKISTSRRSNLNSSKRRLVKIKFWQPQQILNNEHDSFFYKIKSANIKENQRKVFALKLKHQFLRKGNNRDYLHLGSFQEAIRPVVFVAQVFGLMPVYGILSDTVEDLRFSWALLRTWYSAIGVVGFGFCSGINIAFAMRGVFNFDSMEGIMFYTSIFLISIIFFHIARKWPPLMQQWQQVEQNLPPLRTEKERALIAYKIKMVLLVAILCSLGEHILSMLTIVYYVTRCPRFDNQPLESFLFSNFANYFYFFEYTTLAGVLGKVINVYSTFAWSFSDIFVMCLCVALSAKFRQLNELMKDHLKKPTSREFWIERRKSYRLLCRLCESVDDVITFATLVGLTNNLFFLCNKILKSIQKKPSLTHTLYFWYSLIFLMARTFVLALYAAKIHDESKRPLVIFRSIRREYWCSELKRFAEEVNADCIALSGMKFFHLTRNMVLSVAGTLLTYELVLLQFNKEDRVHDCFQ